MKSPFFKIPLQIDPWLMVVLGCFIVFAWTSWGRLIHPIFDTGQEIEIASRLVEGQIIYRDIQSNYTPLAYYINALIILLFGHHLENFYAVGLLLALIIILLSYQLVKKATDPCWAALCAINLQIYCAFNPGGLFNLVAPYSYGAVYATVFCLLAFTTLNCYHRNGQTRWLLIAAVASGLAGLSKQEFGISVLAAVLVGVIFHPAKSLKLKIKRSLLVILITVSCIFIPLAILARQSSWQQIYSSLIPISNSRVLINSGLFYFSPTRTLMVWKDTFGSFISTFLVVGSAIAIANIIIDRYKSSFNQPILKILTHIFISIFLASITLFLLQIPMPSAFRLGVVIILITLSGLTIFHFDHSRYVYILNAIPTQRRIKLITVILCIGLGLYFLIRGNSTLHPLGNLAWLLPFLLGWFIISRRFLLQHQYSALLLSLLAFSILINSRFWFNIDFYGIYAVTSILLFFTFLHHLSTKIKFPILNFVLVSLCLGAGMQLAEFTQYKYSIASNFGTIYTNQANLASAYNHTISYINSSRVKSVLTIPAGAILNFMTATHSPSRETIFLPGILPDAEAEHKFLTQMKDTPPELIVYVDVPFFWLKKGYKTYAEFNPLISDWVTHQHRLVYASSKLLYGDKEWLLRIYDPR